MKLSAQLMFWLSLVYAGLCLAYALFGFSSIDATMSDDIREASRGYAWFWTFLGVIGLVLAGLARWMLQEPPEDGE
jgi:hypothetical protein